MKIFQAVLLIFIVVLLGSQGCKKPVAKETNKPKVQSQADKALDELSEKIKKNPKDDGLYYQRARIFKKQKKLLLAIRDMEKAVSIDSSIYDYFQLLGDLYFKASNSGGAIRAYKKSVELNPLNEEGFVMLGKLYYHWKDRQNSFRYLNEAMNLNKYNPEVYFYKAYNYLEMKDTVKAVANLKASVEVEPEYYNSYMILGLISAIRKDSKAADYYSNALRIIPSSIEALYDRGKFYQDTKNFDLAIEDYKSLLQLMPEHKSASYNLGFIYYLKEKYDSAVYYFSNAIVQKPDFADAYYGRGLSYQKLNKPLLAKKDFESILRINPNDAGAREKLRELGK